MISKFKRVKYPLFELHSNRTIKMSDVKARWNRSWCSICNIFVFNLHDHCKEINDDLHDVLLTLDV